MKVMTETIIVDILEEEKEALKKEAATNNTSVSALVRERLNQLMQKDIEIDQQIDMIARNGERLDVWFGKLKSSLEEKRISKRRVAIILREITICQKNIIKATTRLEELGISLGDSEK